jgi:CRP/FNR family transcriptional regulator, anaerobic regulatory protein
MTSTPNEVAAWRNMMPTTATPAAPAMSAAGLSRTAPRGEASAPRRNAAAAEIEQSRQRLADTLQLVQQAVQPQRRLVRAGDVIYQAGQTFEHLVLLNTGIAKMVSLSPDGREQVVGFKFRGDWLGFDGIAHGRYESDAVAMDTGEVWLLRYDELLAACTRMPALLAVLHQAMSREITRDRDSLMSVCTLNSDARVADFLCFWADALSRRGLRNDHITLRMTRADIGNYLGMTLETVSRALSRLARDGLIAFADKSRRELQIPDLGALGDCVQRLAASPAPTLQ